MKSFSHVQLFVTPWTVAYYTSPSVSGVPPNHGAFKFNPMAWRIRIKTPSTSMFSCEFAETLGINLLHRLFLNMLFHSIKHVLMICLPCCQALPRGSGISSCLKMTDIMYVCMFLYVCQSMFMRTHVSVCVCVCVCRRTCMSREESCHTKT